MPTPEVREPTLSTERLILRAPVERDAEALCAYYVRNDARFAPWHEARSHDVGEYRAWMKARAERDPGTDLTFIAGIAGGDEIVALVTLSGFSREEPPQAMLGYSVDGAYEGHGYASEAVARVLRYARAELGLKAISADYDVGNDRSGRLLQRLGFVEIGRTVVIPGFERHMRAKISTHVSLA